MWGTNMSTHLIWATAVVLCFVICIIPQIIEKFHLRTSEDKYMTRIEFASLDGRVEHALKERKYQDISLKIEIDELHKYLHIRRTYKDGVLHLVQDIQPSKWSDK